MVLDARIAGNVTVICVTTPGEGVRVLEQREERHSQEQRAVPAPITGDTAPTEGAMGNLGIQSTLGIGTSPVPIGEGGIKEGRPCIEPARTACARSSS